MNQLVITLFLFSFSWLGYLTFLFYRSHRRRTAVSPEHSEMSANAIQKICLHRFNPFDEIGGDQSFILCLLDKNNSGVIITSLHGRDFTRVYAKTIKNGQAPDSSLSREEKIAITKLIKN